MPSPLGDLRGICDRALRARLDALETCRRLLIGGEDAQRWIELEVGLINTELADREQRQMRQSTMRREWGA